MNKNIDIMLQYAKDEIRASNALAIIGAGMSSHAGVPLGSQLAPFVWLTLDKNSDVRSKLAEKLGVPDATGKTIIGDDWRRLQDAFAVIAGNQEARLTFQEAFARLDKDRSLHSSPAHNAIARLLHSGTVELAISLNWDTLIEKEWARLYGTSINANVVRLLKPHGDAEDPHGVWILPHEPGYVPDEVVNRVNGLARERPRTVLVVGYSERDETIVERLLSPLSERWRVIRIRPDAAGDNPIPLACEKALPMLADRLCPEPEVPGWTYVTFANLRGLEFAIAGQRLGPADVVACPRLPQANVARQQLEAVHYVEIAAPAGCGKSITVYQVGYDFLRCDWEVLCPSDEFESEQVLLRSASELVAKTVLIVDDAQTFTSQFRVKLSQLASSTRKILITFTDRDAEIPQTIRISNSVAVDALSKAYLKRRDEVLPIVSKLDNHVGERYLDVPIEQRIDEAAKADTPWQFNFILRGGWQHARNEIDALRDLDRADLLLVVLAARQILYLDTAIPVDCLSVYANHLQRESGWVSKCLEVLRKRQATLPEGPLRCPHIRFASVALKCFFRSSEDPEFRSVTGLIGGMICEEGVPLLGISWLLNNLRFADAFRFRPHGLIVTEAVWQNLVARCLKVTDSLDRHHAAFALNALAHWVPCGHKRLALHFDVFGRWLEKVDEKSAYGIATLINDLWNENHDLVHDLVNQVAPNVVAERLAETTREGAYAWGELLGRLALGADEHWRNKFKASLNLKRLIELMESFDIDEVECVSKLTFGVYLYDEEIAFRLLDVGFNAFAAALEKSPLSTWERMQDVIWNVLGHTPRFLRHRKPGKKQKEYSRRIARCLPAERVASDLSCSCQRDWERYGRLLGEWLGEVHKRHYMKIIRYVGLNQLNQVTQGLWATPPRELRLLISTLACDKDCEPARSWVKCHDHEIQEIDPVTTYVAPEAAASVIRRGGRINLFGHNTHDWSLAAYAVARLSDIQTSLAHKAVKSNSESIIEHISRLQAIDCDDLSFFLDVLSKLDAELPQQLLSRVDAETAENHWTMRLKEKTKCIRTVARLVGIANQCQGDIAQLAHRLKKRIPKKFLDAGKDVGSD